MNHLNSLNNKKTHSFNHLTEPLTNKKAFSHLEMIISFSLFIVFLMFLFIYVNPIRSPNVSDVLIDTVELGLNNYKIDFVEIPFAVQGELGGCFNINSPVNLSEIPKDSVYITNEKGENIAFREEGENNLSIKTSGNFYYIYSSDKSFGYHTKTFEGETCNYVKPTFSVPRIKVIYHYEELEKLEGDYRDDYEKLKQNFTFPANSDFAITITTAEGNSLSMNRTKPQMVSVTARDVPIEVLTENTTTKNITRAIMNIQVW